MKLKLNDYWKNIIKRMVITFAEGALAVWAVSGFTLDTFNWKLILGGGIAALMSFLYNLLSTENK